MNQARLGREGEPQGGRAVAAVPAQPLLAPVLAAHEDVVRLQVVGHALGLMSKGYLEGLGYRVDWHSYPMPHSVCAEEIEDLARWLGRRFAAAD